MWSCPTCRGENEYIEVRCRKCGTVRPVHETPVKRCVRCERRFPECFGFCGTCGVPLEPLPPVPVGPPLRGRGESLPRTVMSYVVSAVIPIAGFVGGIQQLSAGRYLSGVAMILLGGAGSVVWWLLLGEYLDLDYYIIP